MARRTTERPARETRAAEGLDVDCVERSGVEASFTHGQATLLRADCMDWLAHRAEHSVHGVVTDPPYALEYTSAALRAKRRNKGVWRLPPSFDGYSRLPVPRFTELTEADVAAIDVSFTSWGAALLPVLVPGAHVLVASNALLSHVVEGALGRAGLEHRGKITRLVHTLRGGDRPKYAHDEFAEVSVLPRAMYEPWLLFRKPLDGNVRENLRKWSTGGLRRPSVGQPFGDVIPSGRAERLERSLAPHPSLKPQAFMRQVVRAILPLGEGVVVDTFAGSGSTLAAAVALNYESIGIERSAQWFKLAKQAIPKLADLEMTQEPTARTRVRARTLAAPA